MSGTSPKKRKKARRELEQILFVLPTRTEVCNHPGTPSPTRLDHKAPQVEPLDGGEVKSFYEEVVGLDGEGCSSSSVAAEGKHTRKQVSPRKLLPPQPSRDSVSLAESTRDECDAPVRKKKKKKNKKKSKERTVTEGTGEFRWPNKTNVIHIDPQSNERLTIELSSESNLENSPDKLAAEGTSTTTRRKKKKGKYHQGDRSQNYGDGTVPRHNSAECNNEASEPSSPSPCVRSSKEVSRRKKKKRESKSDCPSSCDTEDHDRSLNYSKTKKASTESLCDFTIPTAISSPDGGATADRKKRKKPKLSRPSSRDNATSADDPSFISDTEKTGSRKASPRKPPSERSLSSPEPGKRSPKKDDFPRVTKENKVRMINGLMKQAQDGHIAEVRKYLHSGLKVDTRDNFGWTALMCAAHAGNKRMVTYLLEQGARVSVCDFTGKTAVDIATLTKHHKLAKVLVQGAQTHPKKERKEGVHSPVKHPVVFHCEICKEDIKDVSEEKHNASTVHLFNVNLQRGPKGTTYFLPESNKGFQLMVQGGWDKEQGLGSEGQGLKFPPKTLLKRDRHGLGADVRSSKPRITHFAAGDEKAVKRPRQAGRQMKATTLSKKHRQKKARKDLDFERNFRLQFSME